MPVISISSSKVTHRAGSLNSSNRRFVPGELPLPVISRDGGTGAGIINWSDGGAGGRFHFINASSVAYEPPNKTQSVIVTGTDSSGADTVALSITGTFPVYPQKGYEIEYDEETKEQKARDGTSYQREDGKPQLTWKIGMDRRLLDEIKEIFSFLVFHRKTKQFWVYDSERGIMNKAKRTSPIPQKNEAANSWSASVILKGDYVENEIIRTERASMKINSGGAMVGSEWEADQFYTGGYQWNWGAGWVNASGLGDPPPMAVLESVHYDTAPVQYNLEGLIPGAEYLVTCYFAIPAADTSPRSMEVFLQNSSIGVASASNDGVAIEISDLANADDDGMMDIRLELVSGANAIVNAIRVDQQ